MEEEIAPRIDEGVGAGPASPVPIAVACLTVQLVRQTEPVSVMIWTRRRVFGHAVCKELL